MIEYGGGVPKGPDTNVIIDRDGFKQTGHGIRFELDNYADLVC